MALSVNITHTYDKIKSATPRQAPFHQIFDEIWCRVGKQNLAWESLQWFSSDIDGYFSVVYFTLFTITTITDLSYKLIYIVKVRKPRKSFAPIFLTGKHGISLLFSHSTHEYLNIYEKLSWWNSYAISFKECMKNCRNWLSCQRFFWQKHTSAQLFVKSFENYFNGENKRRTESKYNY